MRCIRCKDTSTRRDGHTRLGGQRWPCDGCGRRFTARSASAFSGRGSADEVIAPAVRRYVRFRLSYADVAEWLAERGLIVDRRTVYRWVRRYLPLLGEAARRCRRALAGGRDLLPPQGPLGLLLLGDRPGRPGGGRLRRRTAQRGR